MTCNGDKLETEIKTPGWGESGPGRMELNQYERGMLDWAGIILSKKARRQLKKYSRAAGVGA